jgi:CRP-like cAMP-binding protein
LLSGVDFFNALGDDAHEQIISQSSECEIAKDKYLFYQGDNASAFYLVIKGRIKLTHLDADGDQVIHHYPGPGEAFGIVAVLREMNFPVTAQAVEITQMLYWDEQTFRELLKEHPQIAINSIRILSKFIIDFQNRIQELSSERVERRIARILLRISDQAGKKEERGIKIDIRLTRKDISEMCGTTLFTVSRVLNKWEKEQFVDCSSEFIIIINPHQLVKIAEDI